MKPYPQLGAGTLADVNRVLDVVVEQRTSDIKDFDNLKNTYVSGRKVGKIPTGATNITASDQVGDFNYDSNFIYIVVVNSAGTAEWRRAALASW